MSLDQAKHRSHRTAEPVGAPSMSDGFTFVLILLGCEGEADQCSCFEVPDGCCSDVQFAGAQREGDIIQCKGGIVSCCADVFAGLQEEEETHARHVCQCLLNCQATVIAGLIEQVSNRGDGNWAHLPWRHIRFLPHWKLLSQSEVNFSSVDGVSWVSRAHAGERLAHRAQDPLHLFGSNLFAAGCQVSIPALLCKHCEEWDGVGAVAEEWIDVVFEAKLSPDGPMFVLLLGVLGANAIADGLLCEAKISFEVHLELRWQSCQEFVCGC